MRQRSLESVSDSECYLENVSVNESVKVIKKDLKTQIAELQDEIKESQKRLDGLEKKFKEEEMRKLNVSEFMKWNWQQIHRWIMGLDKGKFKKYDNVLRVALREGEVVGENLLHVDRQDIRDWGIKNFMDKKSLFSHIENLERKNKENASRHSIREDPVYLSRESM